MIKNFISLPLFSPKQIAPEDKVQSAVTATTVDDPVKPEEPAQTEEQNERTPTENKSSGKNKAKKGATKDKSKNMTPSGGQVTEKEVNRCVTCNNEFPTRNKLFDHLKTSGHATALTVQSSAGKTKKEKRKNR